MKAVGGSGNNINGIQAADLYIRLEDLLGFIIICLLYNLGHPLSHSYTYLDLPLTEFQSILDATTRLGKLLQDACHTYIRACVSGSE